MNTQISQQQEQGRGEREGKEQQDLSISMQQQQQDFQRKTYMYHHRNHHHSGPLPLPQHQQLPRHSQHSAPLQYPPPFPTSTHSRHVHLLYYLCHSSRLLEHPHLLQLSLPPDQPAIYLKDVRKRLSSIRGNYLFSAFTWSYRRNYKNVYVWQDVFHDDDLIFPSDAPDHYILKGSRILAENCRPERTRHTEPTMMHQQAGAENIHSRQCGTHTEYGIEFSSTARRAQIVQLTDAATQTEEETSSDESEEEQEQERIFTRQSVTHGAAMAPQIEKISVPISFKRIEDPDPLVSPTNSYLSEKSPVAVGKHLGDPFTRAVGKHLGDPFTSAGNLNRASSLNEKQSVTSIFWQLTSCGRPDLDVRKPTSVFRLKNRNRPLHGLKTAEKSPSHKLALDSNSTTAIISDQYKHIHRM